MGMLDTTLRSMGTGVAVGEGVIVGVGVGNGVCVDVGVGVPENSAVGENEQASMAMINMDTAAPKDFLWFIFMVAPFLIRTKR